MDNSTNPNYYKLVAHLGQPLFGGSAELRFNSPFKEQFRKHPGNPDADHSMTVNFPRRKFMCHKSGMCGSLSYLFVLMGEILTDTPPEIPDWEILKSRIANIGVHEPENYNAELPEWYGPIVRGGAVHRYLLGRGLTDEDIEFYKLGQGEEEFADWVVIPAFDEDGHCEYWVSRRIRKSRGPKYRNPSTPRRFHVGFLYQALKCSPTVVLCEGVFSALAAGRDGVAAYGKYVANTQLAKMRKAGVTGVVVALDGDAWRETVDTAERCYRMGFATWALPMPLEYDQSDMGREAFREYMERWKYPVLNETSLFHLKTYRSR
jgi:hypothetical protein